ncbi:type II toxin-antitoxin system antitoxin SocA domain-containing protein [Fructobacillus ficulneus]|uniref:Phage protein n=1 Tax=Fructobacillus ficulneus TaxID=157463 RepID=A0A0K8MFL3_9LACO|nr:type II toxin-antitoxin system antitoxin SocA domain-containing protein [Fructobacillus ficulneus]GAO99300.1 phage protein [Fructobacillus ficulneus]
MTAPACFDVQTNERVPDSKLDRAAVEMANALYREEFDVVAPEKIKKFRQSNGLSQRDLAKILGWSEATIALYEDGFLPIEANNDLLQEVLTDDTVFHNLLAKASITSTTHQLENVDVLKLAHWFMVQNYFDVKNDETGLVESLGLLKIQKLLYQLKGFSLVRFNVPLYSDDSIAWEYGPVVGKVFQKYQLQRNLTKEQCMNKEVFEDYSDLMSNPQMVALLDEVWRRYGSLKASDLVAMDQTPGSPWSLTQRNTVISNTMTKLYFEQIVD